MRVIYIAGKFRGSSSWDMEQNVRAAETLALEVWKLGAAALCPHANTRFFHGAAPDAVWLDGDIEMLNRCDALLTVDHWTHSAGATAEVSHAVSRGIPVFQSLGDLAAWLCLSR